MFTEAEIAVIIENQEIEKITEELRTNFLEKTAPYFEISNHDFLSLILLSPVVGKAMANNNISFKEEMSLQKKARKLSKGGFFLSKDPVADCMKFLIKKFDEWEHEFYASIKKIFHILFEKETIDRANDTSFSYEIRVMRAPYILVRFISSLFLEREEDILNPGRLRKIEWEKIKFIGEKTGLSELVLFNEFMDAFEVK
ncbi:hypothetical protein MATR_18730 [Marivirga tractuosa]|uniref:Uncharacterized protein n=1 Tax=Marivirga tractuosa (strain ATCC 23168 / DSM 4126 / NBRC 15989 / NCIMB 1408 / VKM B-1430 / H-43) TaxID=643867 RepID=E4TPA3_MARTH|nr:hypothetical protein [Marivirga tractuosa]ADR20506.1 hypothetical protein Ftrac_0501 [Marivirga tractuosa DSM 4126]BDD15048.1 hypothetical protein MATR_18730 [Marivirga tractuosa]